LVYFSRFGILHHEKSGTPAVKSELGFAPTYPNWVAQAKNFMFGYKDGTYPGMVSNQGDQVGQIFAQWEDRFLWACYTKWCCDTF
jgi:hypothetical protein